MQTNSIDYFGSSEEHGCCLTCDEDWKLDHLTNLDNDDFFTCLCRECSCRQCLWYEPFYEDNDFLEGGKCEHPNKQKYFSRIIYSDLEIRNVVNISDKSFLCQIGFSNLIFVPKSVVNNKGFVQKWFIKKLRDKGENVDVK